MDFYPRRATFGTPIDVAEVRHAVGLVFGRLEDRRDDQPADWKPFEEGPGTLRTHQTLATVVTRYALDPGARSPDTTEVTPALVARWHEYVGVTPEQVRVYGRVAAETCVLLSADYGDAGQVMAAQMEELAASLPPEDGSARLRA